MRYFEIEFLDDAKTRGYMEVTDDYQFSRLTDVGGNTIVEMPHQSYRTLHNEESAMPAWGTPVG